MNNELTWEKIVDWVDGRLTDAEATEVAAQIAQADAATRVELDAAIAWLRNFQRLGHEVPMQHLSEPTRQLLRQRFAKRAQSSEASSLKKVAQAIRVFTAHLSSDSWSVLPQGVRRNHPAASGHNAGAPVESRQYIYASEVAEVALNLRRNAANSAVELRGQLLTEQNTDFSAFAAQLIQGQQFQMAALDDLGQFMFPELTPGTYDLVLSDGAIEISMVDLLLQF